MKSKIIAIDGVTLHAESFGNAGDPAVLLIMGAMASGVWWPEELCRMLAARGRFVVRYDHRDTGGSTNYPPGGASYTTEDLADDAMRVLDGFDIDQAHLVGMSLGGYLAQLLALKVPERVLSITMIASERLASADPAMPGMSPRVLEYHAKAAALDWTDRAAVVDYQIGAWRLLSGSAHPFEPDLIRELADADLDRTPNPLTPFNHATLQDASRWTDRLGEIQAPALIIHGTEDIILPYVHAEALHRELRKSRLVTLHGTGHELPRPEWPLIVREIERHTAETATLPRDVDRAV